MPQITFVSRYLRVTVTCLQGVWSRVALRLHHSRPATVFAWLPHFELMQLSKDTAGETCSLRGSLREFNQTIEHAFNPICLSVYRHQTHDGGL